MSIDQTLEQWGHGVRTSLNWWALATTCGAGSGVALMSLGSQAKLTLDGVYPAAKVLIVVSTSLCDSQALPPPCPPHPLGPYIKALHLLPDPSSTTSDYLSWTQDPPSIQNGDSPAPHLEGNLCHFVQGDMSFQGSCCLVGRCSGCCMGPNA